MARSTLVRSCSRGGHGHDWQPPLSHGFKVGVGSVAMAALYERLLERDLSSLDVDAIVAAWPSWEQVEQAVRATHTTPGLDEAAVKETQAKYIDPDTLRARLELLAERWPTIQQRVREQLLSPGELRDMLRAAGCPTGPSDIRLSKEALKATYTRAQMIRRATPPSTSPTRPAFCPSWSTAVRARWLLGRERLRLGTFPGRGEPAGQGRNPTRLPRPTGRVVPR
jgi:hypothetical protein